MVRAAQNRPTVSTQRILDRVLQRQQINSHEHLHLASALLANQRLTSEERRLINQIFDQIQSGRIKLTNEGFSAS